MQPKRGISGERRSTNAIIIIMIPEVGREIKVERLPSEITRDLIRASSVFGSRNHREDKRCTIVFKFSHTPED